MAEVELNGVLVGRAANAHRPHAWEVAPLLARGRNQLSVTLLSAPAYAEQQAAAYPYAVPATQVSATVGPSSGEAAVGVLHSAAALQHYCEVTRHLTGCPHLLPPFTLSPQQVGSLPHYNFIRKAASDFGWDWGPALAPAGMTGSVTLQGRGRALLDGEPWRRLHLARSGTGDRALAQGTAPRSGAALRCSAVRTRWEQLPRACLLAGCALSRTHIWALNSSRG